MQAARPMPYALGGALLTLSAAQAAEPPSAQEMWRIIQEQQKQIETLQERLKSTQDQVQETEEKVEVAGEMIEEAEAKVSKAAVWAERTQIGGYGELHYNNLDSKEEVNFKRFVLYFGHQFTDRVRFFSELELENALASSEEEDPGEVELEQAYIDLDLSDRHTLQAGLFLIPVGILNETHEPTTFYGVERNPVETNIIPTTWWEAGAGLHGELGKGFSYHLDGTSGLDVPTSGRNAFLIRKGRQKVAEAKANDGAVSGRIKWTGMPGVELAATAQWQRDVTQGQEDIPATLLEAHADIQRGPFGLRALYARWDLDKSGVIEASDPAAAGRDEQRGWYVEPSFRTPIGFLPGELGVFARYNVWDNNAGASNDTGFRQVNAGFNYWPVPDVVFKFDAQQQDNEGDKNDNGFNIGMGYQF